MTIDLLVKFDGEKSRQALIAGTEVTFSLPAHRVVYGASRVAGLSFSDASRHCVRDQTR
jgi:hypothetical protein